MKVRDQISSVLLLLEAGKHHLGTGDVLLGVGQVDVEGVLGPGDPLVLVGLGVGEAGCLARLSAPHPVEVGSLLVLASSLDSVALGAGLGEDLLTVISTHYIALKHTFFFNVRF